MSLHSVTPSVPLAGPFRGTKHPCPFSFFQTPNPKCSAPNQKSYRKGLIVFSDLGEGRL
jgi:hypothetical protein